MTSFKRFFATTASLFLIASCGGTAPHSSSVKVSIPEATRNQIQHNLENGVITSPQQVKTNTVVSSLDECSRFKQKLPKDWIQNTLEVPEDPANPNGTKIHIFYYGKLKPGTTPVVFFNGGPGASSHSSFYGYHQASEHLNPNEDVSMIFIDQRGNGCSDYYPQMISMKAPDPIILDRLRHYGSRGIISDAEYVRHELIGDKPWVSFGQSYGAFISHRYATIAPGSLKASFAHANAITSNSYQRLKGRIQGQARVNHIYTSQYPDDLAALKILSASLTPKTCFTNTEKTEKICGAEVLTVFVDLLAFNDEWSHIHEWINLMVDEGKTRPEGVSLFLNALYFGPTNPLNSKRWANRVISWVDRDVADLNVANCKKIRDDLAKDSEINLDEVYMHECQTAFAYASANPGKDYPVNPDVTKLEKDLLTMDDFISALKANSSLQFFWYSGTKDPVVPLEDYTEELEATKGLNNLHYRNFSGTGHDGFLTEPKVWLDLISEVKR